MIKIAFSNQKGGVAKTTSCLNIGGGIAELGYKTLIIDLDTQGQVSQALGLNSERDLSDLFFENCSIENVIIQARNNLFVIPGGQKLASVKREIARRDISPEKVLSEVLVGLNSFDYCLVDTAPSWDVLNVNCLFYVDFVIVPVSMEVLAIQGIVSFLKNVEQIKQYRNELVIKWIVPTFYDARVKKSEEILSQLKNHFGDKVTEPIRYNVRLSEAPGFGKTIFEYNRRSYGANDYAKLIERILKSE